jgi:ATP:corrinoid adenosyltransferase
MSLLKYREQIHTECSLVGSPILRVRAIKIDANKKSLKQRCGCRHLKSCDYFKRKKGKFYFIEISDFHAQLENLKQVLSDKEASKIIKNEIRLKLSETLILHNKLKEKFDLSNNQKLKNRALLTVCKNHPSDIVAFAHLSRELSKHYCPEHFSEIKIIPYMELEKLSSIQR